MSEVTCRGVPGRDSTGQRGRVTGTIAAAIALLVAGAGRGDVVINEIHYEPLDKTIPEEFVELRGPRQQAAGWR